MHSAFSWLYIVYIHHTEPLYLAYGWMKSNGNKTVFRCCTRFLLLEFTFLVQLLSFVRPGSSLNQRWPKGSQRVDSNLARDQIHSPTHAISMQNHDEKTFQWDARDNPVSTIQWHLPSSCWIRCANRGGMDVKRGLWWAIERQPHRRCI